MARVAETWAPTFQFEIVPPAQRGRGSSGGRAFASASVALSESVLSSKAPPAMSAPQPKVDTKPASDVLAGAMARAASQGTIHPLDTLKVRMQAGQGAKPSLSKLGKLIPPAGAGSAPKMLPKIAGLYRGVVGAASGAGIAIGAYFAFYGAASNLLAKHTNMSRPTVAFCAGGIAAVGGSVVKVPLAVCIRSVQAGVYPNFFAAANSIVAAVGVRGLFTGYLPTLLEDVPDMAFKFAAYEGLRSLHKKLVHGRSANVQEDFAMGAIAGAFAAAMTTPLDVIKTNMMCTAASRPSMVTAARAVMTQGGAKSFFRGIGPRALSNGINSAVFFCFFEALRGVFAQQAKCKEAAAAAAAASSKMQIRPALATRRALPRPALQRHVAVERGGGELQPVGACLTAAFNPRRK